MHGQIIGSFYLKPLSAYGMEAHLKFHDISSEPTPIIPYQRCIAKTTPLGTPGTTVLDHCLHTAEVARSLLTCGAKVWSELASSLLPVVAAHDIGKVSPGFQQYILQDHLREIQPELMGQTGFAKNHAWLSGLTLKRYLSGQSNADQLANIVAVHHGSLRPDKTSGDEAEVHGGKAWSKERDRLLEELQCKLGAFSSQNLTNGETSYVSGLTSVSDWIASDERFFDPATPIPWTEVKARAEFAVRQCGFFKPELRAGLSFEDIFGFAPHALQSDFTELAIRRGLHILEAPMGMGKTEAALFASYKLMEKGENQGLYFALPTRLTSNRIYRRIQRFLAKVSTSDTSAKLAHGSAWLEEFSFGGGELDPARSWFVPAKRSLLHPFAIGTIDQALYAVLRVKHNFVRSFALAGRVVVLDEVHSYDAYTGTLLTTLVRHLLAMGCTVILLSATLTSEKRRAFFSNQRVRVEELAYPLITSEVAGESIKSIPSGGPAGREYGVSFGILSIKELAAHALDQARRGQCVLCVCNTVQRAQDLYAAIHAISDESGMEVGLLHSRFTPSDRTRHEEIWIGRLGKDGDRPRACILVATQVAEQSVDIDADYLITDIAPTDMLLQRMGRQWRHRYRERSTQRPETLVLLQGDPTEATTANEVISALGESSCRVYSPYLLWASWQTWCERTLVEIPYDIRDLLEETYKAREELPEYIKELEEHTERVVASLEAKAISASSTEAPLPILEDKEGVATRYSSLPTVDYLIVDHLEERSGTVRLTLPDAEEVFLARDTVDRALAVKLHSHVVRFPAYMLVGEGRSEKPALLQKHLPAHIGLLVREEDEGRLFLCGRATKLAYSSSFGLHTLGPVRQGFDPLDTSRYDDKESP